MRGREQQRADAVRARRRVALADLGQERAPGDDRGDADRDVDDEDPAPVDLDQQPADRRAERGGDAADRRPDPDRDRALLGRERGQDADRAWSG